MIRMDILWSDVQRGTEFDFSRYDPIVSLLKNHDIDILALLHYNKFDLTGKNDKLWNRPPDDFQEFAKKVAMHIAAYPPTVVSRDDLSEDTVEAEKNILRTQLEDSGKPAEILDKIISGRMEKFYSETCLLDQEWSDDPDVGTVKDALTDLIGKLRENIVINRFARFSIGT